MNRLEQTLKDEEIKLEKLEKKRTEIDKKIKTAKSNVEKYKLMLNNYRFNELSNALDTKGVDVNEVIAAAQSGDFGELLKKLVGEQ